MTRLWWTQIRAVVRLEVKKTFFARRGLWIYLLALAPVGLFVLHAAIVANRAHERAAIAAESQKHLAQQDLTAITAGMTAIEVSERLGKPPRVTRWSSDKVEHESDHYSNGESDLYIYLENGKVISARMRNGADLGEDSVVFAGVFQFFYLRMAIFFGCLGIFMNLFRGELLDKSLHFYFLAPIRREVLLVGKYLAGLLTATVIFAISEALQLLVFAWHFDPNVLNMYLYHGHGFAHAAAYLGITVLACIGYGSFFLAAGVLFRNPILPAAAILIWEWINPFLPAILQKFSVIYYLKSLCPVAIPVAPNAPPILALFISDLEPISASVAILGVLFVTTLILFMSAWQVRRMEIDYTTE